MAKIIDGKLISSKIKEQVKQEVEELKAKGINPTLAVILVGQDPASMVYVNSKEKTCNELGIEPTQLNIAQSPLGTSNTTIPAGIFPHSYFPAIIYLNLESPKSSIHTPNSPIELSTIVFSISFLGSLPSNTFFIYLLYISSQYFGIST